MSLGLVLSVPVLAIVISIGLTFHWIYAIALFCCSVYVIWTARRSVLATLAVALCAMAIVYGDFVGGLHPWYLLALLLILPLAVAAAAHARPLAGWFVPCRTAAWTLGWALPVAVLTFDLLKHRPFLSPALAWIIALAVLALRLIRAWQGSRGQVRQQARGGAPGPYPWAPPGPGQPPGLPGSPSRCRAAGAGPPGQRGHPAARGPGGRRAAQPGRSRAGSGPGRRRLAGHHHRRGDGRAGRHDRPGSGQGPGPVHRRVRRGGPAAGALRAGHGKAHAALRVPRAAGHRQDRRGPGHREDLLRFRPAQLSPGDRGAPRGPGRRVPGRDRDQDQRPDRLGARRRAVHRRGLQPGQRG